MMSGTVLRARLFPIFLLAVSAALLPACGGGGDAANPSAALSAQTASATDVYWDQATLNGIVSPGAGPTEAWFEWGTDPSLAVSSSLPAETLDAGSGRLTAVATLPGLDNGTTYYFRLAASDGKATRRGPALSFTTLTVAAVVTGSASAVSSTRATLNGDVDPGGLLATVWFEWGTDPALTGFWSTPEVAVGAGAAPVPVGATVTGLSAGTTYYYRIVSLNGAGTSRGAITSFPARPVPAVATAAATDVTDNAATLNGVVNPNGYATTAWFEWGTDPSFVSYSATPGSAIGSGTADLPVSRQVPGLSAGTTYYFRVAASNSYGTQRDVPAGFTVYPDYFEATGILGTGRVGHVAVLLANGDVLVAGGSEGTDNLAVAPTPETFGAATGTFSATGGMVTHRWLGHTGTRLADGRVLIAGGFSWSPGAEAVPLASAELYNPATRTFSATGPMSVPRAGHTATLLADGRVLIAGGRNGEQALGTAEIYNPSTASFGPAFAMIAARSAHSATLLPNNAVLVAGGLDNVWLPLSTTEIFSVTSGTFAAADNMVSMRQGHAAVRLASGTVLFVGGGDLGPSAAAELYDPATGRFAPTGGLSMPRDRGAFALTGDGRVLAAGGDDAGTCEIYDPSEGTFRPTASMRLPRTAHTATRLDDGSVLIVGGTDESGNAVLPAERFR